jgi:hypothetical protein
MTGRMDTRLMMASALSNKRARSLGSLRNIPRPQFSLLFENGAPGADEDENSARWRLLLVNFKKSAA